MNGSVYYFRISDQQLSAIGGGANFVQLVNADKGTGFGYDLDTELLIHDQFTVTAGLSYNDTEIDDPNLRDDLWIGDGPRAVKENRPKRVDRGWFSRIRE